MIYIRCPDGNIYKIEDCEFLYSDFLKTQEIFFNATKQDIETLEDEIGLFLGGVTNE